MNTYANFALCALLVGVDAGGMLHPHLHNQIRRDVVNVGPSGVCPAIPTTTVLIQPVYYSEFLPYPTIIDPFRDGHPTPVNGPTTVCITSAITTTFTTNDPGLTSMSTPISTASNNATATTATSSSSNSGITTAISSLSSTNSSSIITTSSNTGNPANNTTSTITSTITSTVTATTSISTSTAESTTITSATTTTTTSPPAALQTFLIGGSNSSDPVANRSYLRLINTPYNYPSGYQAAINGNQFAATQFVLQPDGTLTTSDGSETMMIPQPSNGVFAFVFFFPDVATAEAESGGAQTWYELICARTTTMMTTPPQSRLDCEAAGVSVFNVQQAGSGGQTLAISNASSGNSVVLNVIPVWSE